MSEPSTPTPACCTPAPADTPAPAAKAVQPQPCCGTREAATAAGACCDQETKREAVSTGSGCC